MVLFCYIGSKSSRHSKTVARISLGRYLFERLVQLKIGTVFGVARDLNLTLLDKLYETEDYHGAGSIRWAGNCNEINAAYSADGYSRCSPSHLGVLLSSSGSGELSLLNGVAGSFVEHVGLVHIVVMPDEESDLSLGRDFGKFHSIFSNVCDTTTILHNIADAPSEIDRCLKMAHLKQKPVYIGIPSNMINASVSLSLLKNPLDLSAPKNEKSLQIEIIKAITCSLEHANNPLIIVDALVSRYDCKSQVKQLIETTQFPTFVTPMAKGCVDEGGVIVNNEQDPLNSQQAQRNLMSGSTVSSRYGGVYVGSLSKPEVKNFVSKADLILSVGTLSSHFSTGMLTYSYPTKNVIEIHSNHTRVKQRVYQNISMKELLIELNKVLEPSASHCVPTTLPQSKLSNAPAPVETQLVQSWFWMRVSSWLRPRDIVISEGGTSSLGILEARFPNDVISISQILWPSIGYSIGATLGASMVKKEQNTSQVSSSLIGEEESQYKRVILFIGDGSLQFSVQEISTIIRNGATPYIFILNNGGYTTERLLHDKKTAKYNDIQRWNHTNLMQSFNCNNYENIKIETQGDANKLFYDKQFCNPNKIRIIEVDFDKFDAPEALIK